MRDRLAATLYWGLRALARGLFAVGFGFRVTGRQHLPHRGAFLLACNHVSYIDPVVLAAACPRRLVFLAKASLFAIPVLGWLLRLTCCIPIQRREADIGLREAVKRIQHGQPLAMFPEGGRQFSGQLGIAKPGVGWLALAGEVPLIPVLLQGTFQALPPGARWLRRAKIRVAFGEQIRYSGPPLTGSAVGAADSAQALAQQVNDTWRHLTLTTA